MVDGGPGPAEGHLRRSRHLGQNAADICTIAALFDEQLSHGESNQRGYELRQYRYMFKLSKSIFLCGDPHSVFDHIVESVLEHHPAAIILLGDMECVRPLDVELREIIGKTQICYIPGNHDTDGEMYYDNLVTSNCENLHGRVLNVAGVRIGGVGGVFRKKVWDPNVEPEWIPQRTPEAFLRTLGRGNRWRDGLPLRHRSTIFPSELDSLVRQQADVLVTHEAPAGHPNGFEALNRLAQGMGVSCAFHGHHHHDVTYPDGIWHGVGLKGITSLDGTIILAGEII